MYTVDVDVPLNSVLVSFAARGLRSLSLWLHWQRPRDSGVGCASLFSSGP